MTIEKQPYTIRRMSWSDLPPITVEIECAATTPEGVKLGLAVRVAVGRKESLSGAYLSGADLSGAYLSGAYLSGAYLSGAYLSGADLSRADLTRANLSGAYLSGADLSRADLTRANLTRAYLSGANLSGADLTRADLSGANLSGADLTRADLTRANLSGAYLSGADLSRANLTGAEIHGEPVTHCFARVMRDDGYTFLAMQLEAGGVKIAAGCRWFTLAKFRQHVADSYPGEPKAVETLWILSAIEQRAADLGIALEPTATVEEPA
jgi:uncharacterized protein YjbI with pentapeptide repeats